MSDLDNEDALSPTIGGHPDGGLVVPDRGHPDGGLTPPDGGTVTPDGGHPIEEELVPIKRVRDLQSANDKLRARLALAEESLTKHDQQDQTLQEAMTFAVTRYRLALQSAHPDLPEELLTGSSIQELDKALEKGKAIVSKVKESLEKGAQPPVPIGAPQRTEPDWSALSPKEKILRGMR